MHCVPGSLHKSCLSAAVNVFWQSFEATLIEVIFSLDGLGLLGFESVMRRDYPVMFGSLFIFTFIGLIMTLVGDLAYTLVDPRIDFKTRDI